MWRNGGGVDGSAGNAKLIIDNEDVDRELKLLMDAIVASNADEKFSFKDNAESKLFIKMGRHLPMIPSNQEILFCICVCGVFVQSANKTADLQMEVSELSYRSICLLGPFP
jgi:hypothetical protein